MIAIAARRRTVTAAFLSAAFLVAFAATGSRAAEEPLTAEEILKAKCTLCHSGHRIYRISADQIRPVLERMRAMNPDWITEVESDHIAKALTNILADSSAGAIRTAWLESVDRGRQLYNDTSLGTSGKNCLACHPVGSLRNVEESFPRFDPVRKRYVDIQEAINLMIQDKMKGQPLPPNDQKYFDLLAYLKSLK